MRAGDPSPKNSMGAPAWLDGLLQMMRDYNVERRAQRAARRSEKLVARDGGAGKLPLEAGNDPADNKAHLRAELVALEQIAKRIREDDARRMRAKAFILRKRREESEAKGFAARVRELEKVALGDRCVHAAPRCGGTDCAAPQAGSYLRIKVGDTVACCDMGNRRGVVEAITECRRWCDVRLQGGWLHRAAVADVQRLRLNDDDRRELSTSAFGVLS